MGKYYCPHCPYEFKQFQGDSVYCPECYKNSYGMVKPQPTNSIDSELRKEILTEFKQVLKLAPSDYTENCTNVVMSIIATKYISRKEVEEAMNLFGRPVCEHLHHPKKYQHRSYEICPVVEHIVTLRAKLLPPTKGGNDE